VLEWGTGRKRSVFVRSKKYPKPFPFNNAIAEGGRRLRDLKS
jgi:hypothetical protein